MSFPVVPKRDVSEGTDDGTFQQIGVLSPTAETKKQQQGSQSQGAGSDGQRKVRTMAKKQERPVKHAMTKDGHKRLSELSREDLHAVLQAAAEVVTEEVFRQLGSQFLDPHEEKLDELLNRLSNEHEAASREIADISRKTLEGVHHLLERIKELEIRVFGECPGPEPNYHA